MILRSLNDRPSIFDWIIDIMHFFYFEKKKTDIFRIKIATGNLLIFRNIYEMKILFYLVANLNYSASFFAIIKHLFDASILRIDVEIFRGENLQVQYEKFLQV